MVHFLLLTYFVYGAAFFSMGIAIGTRSWGLEGIKLLKELRWLALFGVTHGAVEWMDMFMLLGEGGPLLHWMKLIFLVISYGFLLYFGVCLLIDDGDQRWIEISGLLILSWLISDFVFVSSFSSVDGLLISEVLGRYFLGFGGGIIAAYALLSRSNAISGGSNIVAHALYMAGIFIALYSFSSIITPEAPFYPAAVLNYSNFQAVTSVPIQLLRATLTVGIVYYILTSLTITEVKAREVLEQQVRARTKEWSNTFNAISDFVSVHDKDFRIIKVNKALSDYLGVKPEELIGKHCYEVFHGEKVPWPNCPHTKTLETKKAVTEEVLDPTFGIPLLITTSPIFDENEEIVGSVHIGKDIREQKRAEEAIRKYAGELEDANRLKDLFADIMRHDLQNPVAVVKGISKIIEDDETRPEKLMQLNIIKRSAEKMEELIEASFMLSRIASKEKLDFEKQDVNAIFKRVVKDFKELIEDKGIEVVYTGKGPCLAHVHGMIEDVFANLLSNAVKYSPRNGRVTIGILDEGEHWRISVTDQGEGIPDEYKERIFQRFTRAHKGGVKGTGLGLAIVKRIVELHNGKVWVEDNTIEYCDEQGQTRRKKQGSIFYVSLPKNLKSDDRFSE
jgi:PAS domain S-box-containing protein